MMYLRIWFCIERHEDSLVGFLIYFISLRGVCQLFPRPSGKGFVRVKDHPTLEQPGWVDAIEDEPHREFIVDLVAVVLNSFLMILGEDLLMLSKLYPGFFSPL